MPIDYAAVLTSLFGQLAEVPRLRISDQFPNAELSDQFGRRLKFRDAYLKDGRSLIISPMYTNCRGSCPGTSVALQQLREILTPVFGKRMTIVSFTVDPRVDTPRKLHEYASRYGAEEESAEWLDWHFLTGAPDQIEMLRRGLGFYDLNPRIDRDPTRHDATLLFGNPSTDRWATLPSSLRIPLLVETIRRVAGTSFQQKYGLPG